MAIGPKDLLTLGLPSYPFAQMGMWTVLSSLYVMVYMVMTIPFQSALAMLSNQNLLLAVERLSRCERDATAELIAHLAELDARRLYLGAGHPSLFVYCTAVLWLSEAEAYNRIEVARASRKFPLILERLRDGSMNLTTARLVIPHLTSANTHELLEAASGRSRREVEEILARRAPRAPVPSSVRKLPGGTPTVLPTALLAGPVVAPDAASPFPSPPALHAPVVEPPASRRAVLAPLAPDQYKVTFTASAETYRKLRLAQDLLRHQIPDGSPAEIFDRALAALLENLARRKVGAARRPRPGPGTAPGTRHVPAEVRRAVWLRDGGRCAFVAKSGRRCPERGFVEFHHLRPYAEGGEASVANIALRCRSHNGYEAALHVTRTAALQAQANSFWNELASGNDGVGPGWGRVGRRPGPSLHC